MIDFEKLWNAPSASSTIPRRLFAALGVIPRLPRSSRAFTQEGPVGGSSQAHGEGFAGSLTTFQPGIVLAGRYEILLLLGQGGMGAVYKARDRELDRLVALKVVRPELAGHPGILRRFKQELILARQVTHRNVIRIFDLGEAEGTKFITMEYVEGQDLKVDAEPEEKVCA